MDDLDLERELHRALQVTPSPEFVARVRTTIAEAPHPSIWSGVLRPAVVLGFIAVVAIAVGLWRADARLKPSPTEMQPKRAPATTTTAAGMKTVVDTMTMPTAPHPTAVVRTVPSIDVDTRGHEPTVVAEAPLPEVIIAPDDLKALHEFVTGARDVRFVASFDITPKPIPWTVPETLDNRN